MKKIILLALLSYFLLSPFTYHPDTKLTLRYPALESGQVWDIYGYIDSHKLDIPDFHYPPAHYWWLKFHYPISKFLGREGFDKWLTTSSASASFETNVFRYNFATKLPLLILGVVSGWLIYLIVLRASGSIVKGKIAAALWLFNPVTLYSVVIMGQNDIVAIFLFLLGMYFYEKWWLSLLLWGLSAGVKSYPIIWSVLFLLSYEKNIVRLISKILLVVGTYCLILLPWLSKSYFVEAVLNSGLSTRMFVANIPIGFDKFVVIIPLLLVIVGLSAWKNRSKNKMYFAALTVFQSSLIILGFSHFNPQWMLWCIPFLSIFLGISGLNQKLLVPIVMVLLVWMGLILGFDDKFLIWGLFSPINPNLINFPTVPEYLHNKGGDMSNLINMFQSILTGVAIWFVLEKHKLVVKRVSNFSVDKLFVFGPWLLLFLLSFGLLNIKSLSRVDSGNKTKEVNLVEVKEASYVYPINSNLKYLEFSLNNPTLRSQDSGLAQFFDRRGNQISKEFSGFNAGDNGWIRVDIPQKMLGSNEIQLTVTSLEIKDGLTKVNLDNNNKWLINFYSFEKPLLNVFLVKLMALGWWWILVLGVSVVLFKVKENEQ